MSAQAAHPAPAQPGRAERWMQNIMLAVIVMMGGHVLNTLTSVSTGIASLRERMDIVESNVAMAYSSREARRDLMDAERRHATLEQRISLIERRMAEASP